MASPVIEWRDPNNGDALVTSQALLGNGFNNAIPAGTNSNVVPLHLWNNYANAASIADALTCVLAVYDDATNQGTGISVPTTSRYIRVQVQDYNGIINGADTAYYGIGGTTKHAIPVNGGTISGSGPNYVTVNVQAAIPANATQGSVSQGLWVEYNSTS